MSRTISISMTGPVVLNPSTDNPLYITSSGTVTSSGSSNGVYGGSGATWTVNNAGKVAATGGDGVYLASNGAVSNTGSISGVDAVVLRAGGSVTNNVGGSISSLGKLGSGEGSGSGVFIAGGIGTVTNHAAISGVAYGVGLTQGGLVTNTSSITGGEDSVIVQGGAGTIVNSGTLIATVDDGIGLFSGGSVTNTSGASIASAAKGAGIYITGAFGNVTNAGAISGGYHGLFITNGGSISNATSGTISGTHNGIVFKSQAGTITNSGKITGTSSVGVYLESNASGFVTNTSTGTISGGSFGIFASAGGTVTNAGTISGGSYAVDFTASATNRLVVDPGAVFVGKVGANSSGTNTLELAGGGSTGSINGVNTAFSHFQTLVVDAGATWTLTGANSEPTVLNNGTLNIAGSLTASTAVNPASTGLFQLQTGGTLEFAAATGTNTQVNFAGSSKLIVDSFASFGTNVGASSYAGTLLEGFVNGDTIDLKNFSSTGVTFSFTASSGVLQLTNGSSQHASLDFQASSLGSASFQFASDGASGTFVTTAAGSSPPPPPPAPSITAPSNGSTITTTADPTISGSGISGDTVTVSIDGSVAGSTTVTGGNWSFTPTAPLSNTSHSVTATQAAAGGPSSAPSSADTFTINVPTAPPAPSITAPSNGSTITTTADPTISGSGISGDTVTVSIDGSVAGSTTVTGGNWSFTPTAPLSNTSHSVTATQAAAGGPSSAPSSADTFTISVPPPAPSITAPSNGSTITTTADPTISGSGISGDTVTVSIDGSVAGSTTVTGGNWSFTPTAPLSNTSHSVTATQAAAGGPSSAPSSADTFTISVPAAGAEHHGAEQRQHHHHDRRSHHLRVRDQRRHRHRLDRRERGRQHDGHGRQLELHADGAAEQHQPLRHRDPGGRRRPELGSLERRHLHHQRAPPPAPSITAPSNGSTITTTADPTISGSGISGDTVTVSIDGSVAGSTTVTGGNWSFTPTAPLSNTSHSVTATQAAAGGPSSAPSSADTFTISVPPPAPSITAPSNGSTITTTADPTISGSGISGDTVTVSIDGSVAGSTTVTGGNWSFTPTAPLSNTSHSVTATQAAAGGPSSAPSSADTFTINVPRRRRRASRRRATAAPSPRPPIPPSPGPGSAATPSPSRSTGAWPAARRSRAATGASRRRRR